MCLAFQQAPWVPRSSGIFPERHRIQCTFSSSRRSAFDGNPFASRLSRAANIPASGQTAR
ncbi:hypothetical protein Plhal304r1_c064g0151741 [Plasmopara halstedii]